MKKLLLLLSAASLVMGCNPMGKRTYTSKDGKDKVSFDVKEVAAASDDMNKKTEELKKLTPYTTEQLKALVPEQLGGIKRTSFNVTSMLGYGAADATYRDESGKQFQVDLIDCAGEAGSGMYTLSYWMKMNVESENDNGYTKSVKWNGDKAVESYQKGSDEYELTYMAGDRMLVTVKGEKVGLDALKQAASSLKF
jgi:hypothetical protein